MFYFNVKSIYSIEVLCLLLHNKTLFLIGLNLFNNKKKLIFDNYKKDFIYFEMYFRKTLTRIFMAKSCLLF